MVTNEQVTGQGLSSMPRCIPHLTSVATARCLVIFYRSGVINGSEKEHCRPGLCQHFIGGVLGKNGCHGRHHRATRRGHGGRAIGVL